jgi:hypothetical protein
MITYKSPWETLHIFPWLQIRTVVSESVFGAVAAWNEYRWLPKRGARR